MFRSALCLSVLAFYGCTSDTGQYKELTEKDAKETKPVEAHEHEHEHGPHEGHIVELGAYHGEIVLEGDRKLTLYILDGDVKNAVPLAGATAQANLKIGEEAKAVPLAALPQDGETDGKSSRYQSAEALPESVKDIEAVVGEISLTVDGKPTIGKIEHHHEH
jgi:hypothetical protein